jgi:hypothetical protein
LAQAPGITTVRPLRRGRLAGCFTIADTFTRGLEKLPPDKMGPSLFLTRVGVKQVNIHEKPDLIDNFPSSKFAGMNTAQKIA